MQWIDPLTAMYCGLVGGFIGGAFTMFAQYLNNKSNLGIIKACVDDEIYHVSKGLLLANSRIDAIETKLSTNIVENPVTKTSESRRNKGFYERHPFKQGE